MSDGATGDRHRFNPSDYSLACDDNPQAIQPRDVFRNKSIIRYEYRESRVRRETFSAR